MERHAREVLSSGLRREPDNYTFVRHISRADRAIATDLASRGLRAEALQLAEDVVKTHREWLAREPANSYYRFDLVQSLVTAANMLLSDDSSWKEAAGAETMALEARDLMLNDRPRDQLPPEDVQAVQECEKLADTARSRR